MKSLPTLEKRYHHGDLKAALKQAALTLVRERGPRGFSLNEASRVAGVTVAAPYRHFADKDALLAELACDGNRLLEQEVRTAATRDGDVRARMLAAGMAYLRFAAAYPEYFSVIFNSGLDKSRYPEVLETGMQAFGVIRDLAAELETTPELARTRAVSAWALVHGLATLRADGALAAAGPNVSDSLQPILERFLAQPLGDTDPATM